MPSSRILRSLLFVPAANARKVEKARQWQADAVILDWEDAVLPEDKPLARMLTRELLLGRGEAGPKILVRLNPVSSDWFADDLAALESLRPDGALLSKCRSPEEVERTAKALDCGLCPLIESPLGLQNAFSIATASPLVEALAFGAEDFCAETGIRRSDGEPELLYARSAIVTACRAAGREVYDSPCLELEDLEAVRVSAERSRNLGFSGKLAIHPKHVPVIDGVFSPTDEEVREAQLLLEAFAASPSGALRWKGRMVDEAILRQARRILERASLLVKPR
ncbi:MAG: CoA ester lyase [Acidobacteria bacterium]|nr:CoA ester lyase [Acidobacteriota bacterium]